MVLICTLSDVVLIVAGVAGIGTIVEQAPWALTVVRWLGVAFLGWYGVSSLLRARRAEALAAASGGGSTRRSVVARAAALTWLNPHVYLDTVLLLGTVANHQGPEGRWWFALGACVGSAAWFIGLGYGARLAHRVLSRPRAWQVLDVADRAGDAGDRGRGWPWGEVRPAGDSRQDRVPGGTHASRMKVHRGSMSFVTSVVPVGLMGRQGRPTSGRSAAPALRGRRCEEPPGRPPDRPS